MDYFFDASAGVNFGGDFDFAPSGVGGTSLTSLPDFSAPTSHLDHPPPHHHPQAHASSSSSSSSISFYGSSSSDSSHFPSGDGGRFYSPLNEAYSSSSTMSAAAPLLDDDAAAPDATSAPTAVSTLLPDHVSPSSSSSSSSSNPTVESPADFRRFHDASCAANHGANPEDSSSSPFDVNSDVATPSSCDARPSTASSSFSASSLSNNDNSDSGIVSSSSSSTSCGQENGDAVYSINSGDEVVAAEGNDPSAAAAAPEEPTIDININNVVCSFSVRCHLNLRKVAMEACNTEYNRHRACVSMKLRKPKITASIWNSGKITCIGATSEEDAKIGARRIARILMRMGFNVHFCRFRVVNVLASCTLPFAIRLHKFSAKYPKEVEYEPELHPGATYKIKQPKATLKIFSTGSITITAPHVSHISPSVEHIYPRVQEFRMEEKDKESGEMANLVPQAFVPLNTKHGKIKHIPKGPFHSKFKQVIHQQDLVKKAIQQVKDNESSDEDAMYMGCDDDDQF